MCAPTVPYVDIVTSRHFFGVFGFSLNMLPEYWVIQSACSFSDLTTQVPMRAGN